MHFVLITAPFWNCSYRKSVLLSVRKASSNRAALSYIINPGLPSYTLSQEEVITHWIRCKKLKGTKQLSPQVSFDRHTRSIAEVTNNVGADFLQSPVFSQRGQLVVEVADALLVHLGIGLLQALCSSQQHCGCCHQALHATKWYWLTKQAGLKYDQPQHTCRRKDITFFWQWEHWCRVKVCTGRTTFLWQWEHWCRVKVCTNIPTFENKVIM